MRNRSSQRLQPLWRPSGDEQLGLISVGRLRKESSRTNARCQHKSDDATNPGSAARRRAGRRSRRMLRRIGFKTRNLFTRGLFIDARLMIRASVRDLRFGRLRARCELRSTHELSLSVFGTRDLLRLRGCDPFVGGRKLLVRAHDKDRIVGFRWFPRGIHRPSLNPPTNLNNRLLSCSMSAGSVGKRVSAARCNRMLLGSFESGKWYHFGRREQIRARVRLQA